ncbi:hypothetical protein L2E82_51206 [Cichorium intybus]|nr:hypothetical protein L2E82_51206 [Cichorium intybus]
MEVSEMVVKGDATDLSWLSFSEPSPWVYFETISLQTGSLSDGSTRKVCLPEWTLPVFFFGSRKSQLYVPPRRRSFTPIAGN